MITEEQTLDLKDILRENNVYYYHDNFSQEKIYFLKSNDTIMVERRLSINNKNLSYLFTKVDLSGVIVISKGLVYILSSEKRTVRDTDCLEYYIEAQSI